MSISLPSVDGFAVRFIHPFALRAPACATHMPLKGLNRIRNKHNFALNAVFDSSRYASFN
jgi:hypothetical protein